jgi:hypothetical protein
MGEYKYMLPMTAEMREANNIDRIKDLVAKHPKLNNQITYGLDEGDKPVNECWLWHNPNYQPEVVWLSTQQIQRVIRNAAMEACRDCPRTLTWYADKGKGLKWRVFDPDGEEHEPFDTEGKCIDYILTLCEDLRTRMTVEPREMPEARDGH